MTPQLVPSASSHLEDSPQTVGLQSSSTATSMTESLTPRSATSQTSNQSNNNKQHGGNSNRNSSSPKRRQKDKELPALFFYMEAGQWRKASARLRRHPKEAKTWATLKTKTGFSDDTLAGSSSAAITATSSSGQYAASAMSSAASSSPPSQLRKVAGAKRLALHHACFKLRNAAATPPPISNAQDGSNNDDAEAKPEDDPFIAACEFILELIELYPQAAGQRESRHGCLPLHLAAFASCVPQHIPEAYLQSEQTKHNLRQTNSDEPRTQPPQTLSASTSSIPSSLSTPLPLTRPAMISRRAHSDATADTHLSAVLAEETYTGGMGDKTLRRAQQRSGVADPTISVAMRPFYGSPTGTSAAAQPDGVDELREEMAVNVINALLDAYPKAVKMDCEGGRLPLHTACAGRASPRVISTLVTSYTAAARHRNKDGFLPLHLAAHWGVSDPKVATTLLRAYPDATVGRNRWERTPLEEALCMAGENGRPHQIHLVRALRKHPSYWTRPPRTIEHPFREEVVRSAIDIDESLPSMETPPPPSSTHPSKQQQQQQKQQQLDEEAAAQNALEGPTDTDDTGMDADVEKGGAFGGGRLLHRLQQRRRRNKESEHHRTPSTSSSSSNKDPIVPTASYTGKKLSSLIHHKMWSHITTRLASHPMEAEEELEVMTKGGFLTHTGMTALHYICERNPPVTVVRALIDAFPLAVLKRAMPGGCLPLHIACTWHASPEVVVALLEADKGAVHVKDELGNLPLHSALFSGSRIAVVEALLHADPQTVFARNHQGSRPADIGKRLRHDNRQAVLQLLTMRKKRIMAQHKRSSSSGTWAEVAQQAAELNQREGAPMALPIDEEVERHGDLDMQEHDMAVEVTYHEPSKQELLWI